MKRALVLVIPFMLIGCATLDTTKLKEDMTIQEVRTLFGKPKLTHFKRVSNNKVEVWDYLRYPSKEIRIWFLNDKVKLWQSGILVEGFTTQFSILGRPPDFGSPNAPDFILEMREKVKSGR